MLTQAVLQQQFKGVSDPDQAWMLGELIRYLEHPRSGALSFHDMGFSCVPVRGGLFVRVWESRPRIAKDPELSCSMVFVLLDDVTPGMPQSDVIRAYS